MVIEYLLRLQSHTAGTRTPAQTFPAKPTSLDWTYWAHFEVLPHSVLVFQTWETVPPFGLPIPLLKY